MSFGGIRIHYYRDLKNWFASGLRSVKIDQSIPLITDYFCPACRSKMHVLVVLRSRKSHLSIRQGQCPKCYYIGYIDKPSKKWIDQYYFENWDNAKRRSIKKEIKKHFKFKPFQTDAADLVQNIKEKGTVCDIGCGKGKLLNYFQALGFKKVLGIENSLYRARLTTERFKYPVILGNLEEESVIEHLKKFLPIQLFASSHVLEHVYNPNETIEVISKLQDEGQYLLLALPNIVHEPKINTLLWLPHLHSFTRKSIEILLNRHNYAIEKKIDAYDGQIIVLARKVKDVQSNVYEENKFNYKEMLLEYFGTLDRKKRFIWKSKTYKTLTKFNIQNKYLDLFVRFLEDAYYLFASRLLKKFNNSHSLVASPIKDANGSYFVVEFDGDIELLVR